MPQRTSNLSRSPAGSFTGPSAILLSLMLAVAALPVSAAVTISVEAATNSSGIGDQATNAGNEFPPGGRIHGVAVATRDDATAFVANGNAGPCDFFNGVGCAYELPQSRAMGEIRGDLGRLRAAVYTSTEFVPAGVGLSVAEVVLGLQDVVRTNTLGNLTFDLHFDVDVQLSGIPSTQNENFFQLDFSLTPLIAGATPTQFEFTTVEFQGGPTVVDRSFLLSDLPADTQVLMTLDIVARNECGVNIFVAGGNACSIWTNAGNTAYIGVQGDYVSLAGYSYPGFAAAVPEPATSALLAAGLGVLAALGRRTSRRRPAA